MPQVEANFLASAGAFDARFGLTEHRTAGRAWGTAAQGVGTQLCEISGHTSLLPPPKNLDFSYSLILSKRPSADVRFTPKADIAS